jgi:hypothetical protein
MEMMAYAPHSLWRRQQSLPPLWIYAQAGRLNVRFKSAPHRAKNTSMLGSD